MQNKRETPQMKFERVYAEAEKILKEAGYDSGYAEELGIGLGEYTTRKDGDYWHLEFLSNSEEPKRFEAESYVIDAPMFLVGNIRGFGGMREEEPDKWLIILTSEIDKCNEEKLKAAETRIKPWLSDVGYNVKTTPIISENEDRVILSLLSDDEVGYTVPNIFAEYDKKKHTVVFHADGMKTTNYMDWTVKVKEFTEEVKFLDHPEEYCNDKPLHPLHPAKVPDDMKAYVDSFRKEGDIPKIKDVVYLYPDLDNHFCELPEKLEKMYLKLDREEEETYIIRYSRYHPDDIKEQENKLLKLRQDFKEAICKALGISPDKLNDEDYNVGISKNKNISECSSASISTIEKELNEGEQEQTRSRGMHL